MCKRGENDGSKTSSKTCLPSSGINTVGYCTDTGNNLLLSIYEEILGPFGWGVSSHS